MNGLATPGVMPPFGLGLGTPALASAYGGALPSLNAFALASNGALGTPNPANVRGLSNVLLVSNLNDEVNRSNVHYASCLYLSLSLSLSSSSTILSVSILPPYNTRVSSSLYTSLSSVSVYF